MVVVCEKSLRGSREGGEELYCNTVSISCQEQAMASGERDAVLASKEPDTVHSTLRSTIKIGITSKANRSIDR